MVDLAGIDLHAVDLGAEDCVVRKLVHLRIVAEDDAIVIPACRLNGVFGADNDVGFNIGVAGVLHADAVAPDVDVVVMDAHAVYVVVALRERAASVKAVGAVVLRDRLADNGDALALIGCVDIADRAYVVERVVGDVDVRLLGRQVAVGDMGGGVALSREGGCLEGAAALGHDAVDRDAARGGVDGVARDADVDPVHSLDGAALDVIEGVVADGDTVEGIVENGGMCADGSGDVGEFAALDQHVPHVEILAAAAVHMGAVEDIELDRLIADAAG